MRFGVGVCNEKEQEPTQLKLLIVNVASSRSSSLSPLLSLRAKYIPSSSVHEEHEGPALSLTGLDGKANRAVGGLRGMFRIPYSERAPAPASMND